MIQDYKPSSRSLSFIRPRFSRHRSPFSPRSDPSLLSLPGPSPYIMCLVRPVARIFIFELILQLLDHTEKHIETRSRIILFPATLPFVCSPP
ncbi:hypothetical protein TNCV_2855871 [Trichonephila clavipes]|nr:hypothetical protein TNCV_2855871 [Trichonephila clavipes]